GSARVARIAPLSSVEVEFEIEVDRNFSGIGQMTLDATVSNDAACDANVERSALARINVDETLDASTIDTVETTSTPWTTTGVNACDIWSRVDVAPFDRAWFGVDFADISDTALESPALQVGTTAPFVI